MEEAFISLIRRQTSTGSLAPAPAGAGGEA